MVDIMRTSYLGEKKVTLWVSEAYYCYRIKRLIKENKLTSHKLILNEITLVE